MPKPLRILHLSTRLILGGSQENTVLSCEGQSRLGHEVHLAHGPIYGPEGSLLDRVAAFACVAPDGSSRRIVTHEVPDLVREVSPRRDAKCLGQLKRLIRDVRPDVIHTHSSKAGILGRMAGWAVWQEGTVLGAEGAKRPAVVHTIHGPPFMPIEGGAFKRLKIALGNAIYTLAERYAAARCHAIVSVADAMTEQFLSRNIGYPELYTTVRSGIDLAPFANPGPSQDRDSVRGALGLRPGHFVVGTVARLAEHKGHADLLAAIKSLEHPTANIGSLPNLLLPNLVLLWVGDGWLRESLLATARADHSAPRFNVVELDKAASVPAAWAGTNPTFPTIVLTGLVPPQRIPSLIRAMDVLCHPSYREGLPRTVPQALLCGVCPVAYDVDGTKEACIDGVTGKLISPGNISALAAAILWMHDHPTQRAALAAAGREMCLAGWSTEAMVAGLDNVYLSALKRAAQP